MTIIDCRLGFRLWMSDSDVFFRRIRAIDSGLELSK